MAPGKFRECKQCFRVVTAKHFRRHLSSHDHQIKACVLAMGRKILAQCATCKNTKIAQIRVQCIQCCQTLEKMYDSILKPLEISNGFPGASSSAPQTLKVSKLDSQSLSRTQHVFTPKTSSTSKLDSISKKNPHIIKQLSYDDQLFVKSQKALYKSPKSLNINNQPFSTPSSGQPLKEPNTSGSKASSLAARTKNVYKKSSQRTSDECSYTRAHKNSASKQSTRNPSTSSFDQQQLLQSSQGSYEEAFEVARSKVCSMPDKPVLRDEHYYPRSYDKAFEKAHKITQTNDCLTITTYPSVAQTMLECTTISVQVVEKMPNVSEYIFKFSKFSPCSDPQQKPSSCVVQPDNKINESVTSKDPSTTTSPKNLRDPRALRHFQQELIDLFPDMYSDEPTRPCSPMTMHNLVTTLSAGNEHAETIVYDDWFLATDLKFTDYYNPIETTPCTKNEGID